MSVKVYLDTCHTVLCEHCSQKPIEPYPVAELYVCAVLELLHGETYCSDCGAILTEPRFNREESTS